ncbi:response regulator [Radicibacter daui]|uniref:response regulator n=1 Tax=Radicibacter daui TaxID=3064829 RepID=UPI00404690FD
MILIVEDMPDQRFLMRSLLNSANLPSQETVSAEQGLEVLEIGRTDGPPSDFKAILMDVELPGIDGIEAICLIKQNPRLADIPVIVVSAREDDSALIDAFIAGAIDYVTKPYSEVQLVTRIRGALRLGLEADRRRQRERELQAANAALTSERRLSGAIDHASGRPESDALPLIVGARDPGLLWVLRGEVDGWANLKAAEGEQAAIAIKKRVLDALAATQGQLGDQLVTLPEGGFAVVIERPASFTPVPFAEALAAAVVGLGIRHPRTSGWPVISVSIGCGSGTNAVAAAEAALNLAKTDVGNRVEMARPL